MADSCQMENGSVVQERGTGEGEGENRHSKVRTIFFSPRRHFFKTTRRKYFIFWSHSPQALQNVDALLSSWKIRAMITLKKFYLSECLPSM